MIGGTSTSVTKGEKRKKTVWGEEKWAVGHFGVQAEVQPPASFHFSYFLSLLFSIFFLFFGLKTFAKLPSLNLGQF
jgi:hypothetical protein